MGHKEVFIIELKNVIINGQLYGQPMFFVCLPFIHPLQCNVISLMSLNITLPVLFITCFLQNKVLFLKLRNSAQPNLFLRIYLQIIVLKHIAKSH